MQQTWFPPARGQKRELSRVPPAALGTKVGLRTCLVLTCKFASFFNETFHKLLQTCVQLTRRLMKAPEREALLGILDERASVGQRTQTVSFSVKIGYRNYTAVAVIFRSFYDFLFFYCKSL